MARIFVSYRRDDEPGFARALFSHLATALRRENVFMDVEGTIRAGQDFVKALEDQISNCDILLAVIGPRWIDAKDEKGQPRLENVDDFVRVELTSALELGKRVIPVLVGGAPMPRGLDLPEVLRALARRQAVRLAHERFEADCHGLLKDIREVLDAIDAENAAREKQSNDALQEREMAEWEAASRANTLASYESFIRAWPSGQKAATARSRLRRFESIESSSITAISSMRIFEHSSFLYWWIVWFYGFACAAITALQGMPTFLASGDRSYLFHPEAWVGLSFISIVLLVGVATNISIRGRGVFSFVALIACVLMVGLVHAAIGWDSLLASVPLPLPYMNLSYYVLFSVAVFSIWIFIVLVADRGRYWRISPGQISAVQAFGGGSETFSVAKVVVTRLADDLLMNKILGLSFLGFGTGDIQIRIDTPGSGSRTYILKNVWRVRKVHRDLERIIRQQA